VPQAQASLQLSSLSVLPSSQTSDASRMPSPQMWVTPAAMVQEPLQTAQEAAP
jgi:hypothetical protein